jgi:hypothetical protein
MSVVVSKVETLNLRIELRDKRTLYIDGRPCQAIKSKWYENSPGCKAMSRYMPRNDFADFLLYVPDGQDIVYVVPRGMIAHDTAWAASALEPYKDAWHLLKKSKRLVTTVRRRRMQRSSICLDFQLNLSSLKTGQRCGPERDPYLESPGKNHEAVDLERNPENYFLKEP